MSIKQKIKEILLKEHIISDIDSPFGEILAKLLIEVDTEFLTQKRQEIPIDILEFPEKYRGYQQAIDELLEELKDGAKTF